ncbi:MAG: glycosyltransferase [Anaerolineae bacterium]|nr:glycosyltransferase [Anaerolineae bacterium]
MPVTLVHDWLNQYGGAERVLEHLVRIFPQAPIYTSIYWREGMPASYADWDIRPSWMDRLPGIYRHHQAYFPLYALAFGRMDLSSCGSDLVISNKSGFCHAVQTGSVPHLCYCLAPTRYVWEFDSYAARENLPGTVRALLRPVIAFLRRWDYRVAQQESLHFLAISTEIQARIKRYYQRVSDIVYPPVDVHRFSPVDRPDDYYLIVSRLVPYKRIDLAVRAFTEMGLPLVVAGDGRDRTTLEAMAGPSVTFRGYVPDADLPQLLAHCRALIFPGREDFGLTPVEAQAAGRPVIAYGAGGALDTVVDGVTGTLFAEPTVGSLIDAVERSQRHAYDPRDCRRNAERFGPGRFRAELLAAAKRVSA